MAKPIRYSLWLSEADYRRLCAEWMRRSNLQRVTPAPRLTVQAIIVDAIRKQIPAAAD